jgi:hypothetical protein
MGRHGKRAWTVFATERKLLHHPPERIALRLRFWKTLSNGTATGSAHLVAANGDSIDTTVAGSSEPTATPGVNSEINTITGGTGRFAAAEGSFTVERLINLATGFTSGSFHGTITSPGAAR